MKFFQLVSSRRSVRTYLKDHIDRKDIERCAGSACLSPSACNSQPWKFIIIDDPALLGRIREEVFSGIYSMNSFACEAPALIAIVAERLPFIPWLGSLSRTTDFRRIDIGIACAHLVLGARELNIGTCILGWFNERILKRLLAVPSSKKIELVISLGYIPSDTIHAEKILKDKHATISYNRY